MAAPQRDASLVDRNRISGSIVAMSAILSSSNIQEFTVSDLALALKRVVEDRFGYVRVRGEISGYRGPHSSGHAYFSIKDQNAKIDAVIWKGVFAKMRIRPEEGLEVIASGKVTTFAGKSTYQLVVDSLEPAGVGALMALLEARRVLLAAEGLFAGERKKPLPYIPRVIGIVTSPTGAVIRDILHRIAERFSLLVIVWPVRVQGDNSGAEIVAAISGFNSLPKQLEVPTPDLIIVARGGGSLEDLWSFNDEIVVRAAASSVIPLISAVGHETDWTLIDQVADLRAPTPSAAAEMAVPVRAELLLSISDYSRRHAASMLRILNRMRGELRNLQRLLPGSDNLLAPWGQRNDLALTNLRRSVRVVLEARVFAVVRVSGRLAALSPQALVARDRARHRSVYDRFQNATGYVSERKLADLRRLERRLLTSYAAQGRMAQQTLRSQRDKLHGVRIRMTTATRAAVLRRVSKLESQHLLLRSLGYQNVLARGFALVRDCDGRTVRSVIVASGLASLDLQFVDGHVDVSIGRSPSTKPKENSSKRGSAKQGSLF